jgi:hypothetical protein
MSSSWRSAHLSPALAQGGMADGTSTRPDCINRRDISTSGLRTRRSISRSRYSPLVAALNGDRRDSSRVIQPR